MRRVEDVRDLGAVGQRPFDHGRVTDQFRRNLAARRQDDDRLSAFTRAGRKRAGEVAERAVGLSARKAFEPGWRVAQDPDAALWCRGGGGGAGADGAEGFADVGAADGFAFAEKRHTPCATSQVRGTYWRRLRPRSDGARRAPPRGSPPTGGGCGREGGPARRSPASGSWSSGLSLRTSLQGWFALHPIYALIRMAQGIIRPSEDIISQPWRRGRRPARSGWRRCGRSSACSVQQVPVSISICQASITVSSVRSASSTPASFAASFGDMVASKTFICLLLQLNSMVNSTT